MERRRFLDRIHNALGKSRPSLESVDTGDAARVLAAVTGRTPAQRKALVKRLQINAQELHVALHLCKKVGDAGRGIVQLVENKNPEWGTTKQVVAWDHPLIGQLGLEKRLADIGVGYRITPSRMAERPKSETPQHYFRQQTKDVVTHAFVGVTSADYCLAETATLVLKTRPGEARSVSLLPSIHAAVIKQNRILADFKELCALLSYDAHEHREGLTNCLTLISGPSKTADIEAVMVEGVHGPREVHLYVIL